MKFWPLVYYLWTGLAIGISLVIGGWKYENITRLLVVGLLLFQMAFRSVLVTALIKLTPRQRFIIIGTFFAAVVEGFHMISMPVFNSLRISAETPLFLEIIYYVVDLLFTIPAYLVIFSVIWFFINRIKFSLWQYAIVMGLAQTLGDGGLVFFLKTPAMLLFLPYPMTNYHAINIIPFLAVREHLAPKQSRLWQRLIPVPIIILIYFVCGVLIKLLGRLFGLD